MSELWTADDSGAGAAAAQSRATQVRRAAQLANAGQVRARCEAACQAPACFGMPWRGSEGHAAVRLGLRGACERAAERSTQSNSRSGTAGVRAFEVAKHHFGQSLPNITPHLKLHI